MPRPSKKSQYKVVAKRVIYAVINPLTKEFYIGHAEPQNLKNHYSKIYNIQKYKTDASIKALKDQGLKPCMFVLEEVQDTKVIAYRYVVVWTRIFLEQGYINLDKGEVISYANDLLEDNIVRYNERKQADLRETCVCQNCVFPNYGKKMCPLKKTNNQ